MILAGASCPAEALEVPLRKGGVAVVDHTVNPDEIAGLVARRRPDLLVAAASSGGWGWLREAKERVPSLRIIVVGGAKDPERIDSALRAGATAYVVAGAADGDFALAVRQSFERSLYFEPTPSLGASAPPPARNGVSLTPREAEIVGLVAQGLSNGKIARKLWLTEQTVKFHLSNVYRKLGVKNRTDAGRWAHRNGLVPYEEPVPAR